MNAIYLTLFVSLVLAGLGIVLFLHSAVHKDRDHIDRLALLPLEDDDVPVTMSHAAVETESNPDPNPNPNPNPNPTTGPSTGAAPELTSP